MVLTSAKELASASQGAHPENRQKLVKTVTDKGGSDMNGSNWLSAATVEGLKSKKDDDAALFEYIKTTAAGTTSGQACRLVPRPTPTRTDDSRRCMGLRAEAAGLRAGGRGPPGRWPAASVWAPR